MNEKIENEKKDAENEEDDSDFIIDFTTSSAINRVSLKFLVVYIPIFWFSGIAVATFWYGYTVSSSALDNKIVIFASNIIRFLVSIHLYLFLF
ncbi:MAG: hypothetical protein ACTSPU_12300 [Promethearchaeota archaeon]